MKFLYELEKHQPPAGQFSVGVGAIKNFTIIEPA
jgi:hypothetical protein